MSINDRFWPTDMIVESLAPALPMKVIEEEARGLPQTRCLFVTEDGLVDCRREDFPGVSFDLKEEP